LTALVDALKPPRKILLMVKAGAAVDALLEHLIPLLSAGDIVIDGGNSHYEDTTRRCSQFKELGMRFVGCGISGGEEGARHGPALMPGGHRSAWPELQPIFEAIAARVKGEPCCRWMGEGGAGHYVKMVHNGIEYGDMQLIAEAYHLLHDGLGLSAAQLQTIFQDWNRGPLDSYLIEITGQILGVSDKDGQPLLDKILDAAGQKGTGNWTVISALELGVPLTLIAAAVFARSLSAHHQERQVAAQQLGASGKHLAAAEQDVVAAVHDALYAAKIISYAQGFMLLRAAAETFNWDLNYRDIALTWRGGCIIRSAFLNDIAHAYEKQPNLTNLLLDNFFSAALSQSEAHWRQTVVIGSRHAIPLPAMAEGLAFYDGYRCPRLPANLLQAQRDLFGAHQYERLDSPRGTFFHSDW
ncbi:MAG: phosphogluconate dehydrogenase (NADP(+)-dependent, decarboxylating), partial [Desulfuromonadales bacterium C00003107]